MLPLLFPHLRRHRFHHLHCWIIRECYFVNSSTEGWQEESRFRIFVEVPGHSGFYVSNRLWVQLERGDLI